MATSPHEDRLADELSLLQSMYPDQIQYNEKARELSYKFEHSSFQLRIPDDYPLSALPDVLAASKAKVDLREQLKGRIAELSPGEEVLDTIVLVFNNIAVEGKDNNIGLEHTTQIHHVQTDSKATMVIWVHHLLNTNKRKQALSPPSALVSGVTKPGYPGVLIYSGSTKAVHNHVNELKRLNWQAFQVRLESEEEWRFAHGPGMKEVESMKDVVSDLEEARKEIFLAAMRMK
ncbi:hypothetical protein M433DRAFT_72078 [Acidomyces richmondensis BFW]|nr:MAG: hypothetical protein FE78DRAFT_155218 [Acidomyces sp. 'richmondensis']KYG43263.1 hypothetical protein M433DRAFT_72078 [Acidomyces richmondensis BFW]